MNEGWIRTTLGEAASIVMGQSPPGSTYNTARQGLPFIQGSAEFGTRHPSPNKWCSEPKKVAEPGDLLVSVRAPVGDSNFAHEKIAVGRGLAVIRGSERALVAFLGLAIQDALPELRSRSSGGVFDSITKKGLASLNISLPPIEEQQRIVELIAAIDNARLWTESVASSAAEAARSLLMTYKAATGARCLLSEVADLRYGAALKASDRIPGECSVFGSAGRIGEHTDSLVEGPCIVVGRKGVHAQCSLPLQIREDEDLPRNYRGVGGAGVVRWSERDTWVIDTAYFVTPRQELDLTSLFWSLVVADLPSQATKTTLPGLSRTSAQAVRIPHPSDPSWQTRVSLVERAQSVAASALRQVAALDELRKTLLSALLSGERQLAEACDELSDTLG